MPCVMFTATSSGSDEIDFNPDMQVESSGVRVEASYVTVSHTPGVCPPPSITPRINYEDIDHKTTQVSSVHEYVI